MGVGVSQLCANMGPGSAVGVSSQDSVVTVRVDAARSSLCPLGALSPEEEGLVVDSLAYIMEKRPDFFHKVWMKAIRGSPRLNEIIALNHYCVRDLRAWPKLDALSTQQRMSQEAWAAAGLGSPETSAAIRALGARHFQFSAFGLQAVHFDIWRHSFAQILGTVPFETEEHKCLVEAAWAKWIKIVCDIMMEGYNGERRSDTIKRNRQLTAITDTHSIGSAVG